MKNHTVETTKFLLFMNSLYVMTINKFFKIKLQIKAELFKLNLTYYMKLNSHLIRVIIIGFALF